MACLCALAGPVVVGFFALQCLVAVVPAKSLVSGTTLVHWPDWAMARAEPELDYRTTRFGGPQPDPVSGLCLPSYGCGAVWPGSLQLDAVCQVAALFCPDLFLGCLSS